MPNTPQVAKARSAVDNYRKMLLREFEGDIDVGHRFDRLPV
jgi:hypothetical protein